MKHKKKLDDVSHFDIECDPISFFLYKIKIKKLDGGMLQAKVFG